MTRGNRLPVAWLALVGLVALLPAAASGQPPEVPQDDPPVFRPLLSDLIEAPVEPPPQPTVVETRPYRPEDAGLPGRPPEGGAVHGGPGGWDVPVPPAPSRVLGRGFLPWAGHGGVGRPSVRESWLYRPFSAAWFGGMVQGGPLIDDWVGMQRGFLSGYRIGWDHDPYWGGEIRFYLGSVTLCDSQRAIAAQKAVDDAAGMATDDPQRQRFDHRDCDITGCDLNVLYYPWGDARWRPYLMAGLGATRLNFTDRLSESHGKPVMAMPLALGLKYRCTDWLALRFECADNIAFGRSSFNTLHNLSVTGAVELRFGGARTAYWPWKPGRHYW